MAKIPARYRKIYVVIYYFFVCLFCFYACVACFNKYIKMDGNVVLYSIVDTTQYTYLIINISLFCMLCMFASVLHVLISG